MSAQSSGPSKNTIIHVTDCHEMTGGVHQLSLLMQGIRRVIGAPQILVCRPGGSVGSRFRDLGFEVHEIGMFQDYDLVAVARLGTLIHQTKPWLVHAHHPTAHAIALVARHFLRFPLVVSRRVTHPIPWYPTSRWKYASSKINLLVCVSQAVKEELEKAGVAESRLVVIGSSTDLKRFAPRPPDLALRRELQIPQEAKVLSLVANYSPWKGQDFFLQAFANWQGKNKNSAVLILAGRDTQSQALKEKVAALGLGPQVRLLGWRSDVENILSISDGLVCPSLSGEGSSGAIREAFSMGVAVLASDISANRELVEGGRGWLFRSNDVSHCAEALDKFVQESPLIRQNKIERAQQFVTENFSVDAMVRKTLEAYQRVV